MAKTLPDDVFQVGAITLAKLHLRAGKSIEQMAETLWRDYSSSYDDPEALRDWIKAANVIVEYLRNEIQHPHAAAVAHHAQYYCMHFDDEGQKRKRGLGGLFRALSSPSIPRNPVSDRTAVLLTKFKRYQSALDAGLNVPEAPDGWGM